MDRAGWEPTIAFLGIPGGLKSSHHIPPPGSITLWARALTHETCRHIQYPTNSINLQIDSAYS